jgi:hypothetical protein
VSGHLIVGNDLRFPKLRGLARNKDGAVSKDSKGKGAEKSVQELVRSGKRRKVEDVQSRVLNELQISNYFERARKEDNVLDLVDGSTEDRMEDLDGMVVESTRREVVPNEKDLAVDKERTAIAEVSSLPKESSPHKQRPSDDIGATLKLDKKDASTQVDVTPPPELGKAQHYPIASALSPAQQWAHDILTDPPVTETKTTQPPDKPTEIAKTNTRPSLQNISHRESIPSPTNSTKRLISYAESLLPGGEWTNNPKPTRVLFSMDDHDGKPVVWGNSYNPFDVLSPDIPVENLPEIIDLQNSAEERVVECYMYRVLEEDDQVRYITGPKPDPERNQIWKYGRHNHDETSYNYDLGNYMGEKAFKEGEFKGGKHGEIDIGERVPLIRGGLNHRNRY